AGRVTTGADGGLSISGAADRSRGADRTAAVRGARARIPGGQAHVRERAALAPAGQRLLRLHAGAAGAAQRTPEAVPRRRVAGGAARTGASGRALRAGALREAGHPAPRGGAAEPPTSPQLRRAALARVVRG